MNEYITQGQINRRRMKLIGLWIGVAVIVAGSIFALYKVSQLERNIVINTEIYESDHKRGPDSASVKLVEYADFQCPACRAFSPIINQLTAEFGDQIQLIYRHLPLKPIHPNAVPAAIAAEAAHNQGKFWEMGKILYENQPMWSTANSPEILFIEYAGGIGLDVGQFSADMRGQSTKDKVESHYQTATEMGLNSTPTFFLNGKKITTPTSYEQFKQIIQSELDRAQQGE